MSAENLRVFRKKKKEGKVTSEKTSQANGLSDSNINYMKNQLRNIRSEVLDIDSFLHGCYMEAEENSDVEDAFLRGQKKCSDLIDSITQQITILIQPESPAHRQECPF